METKSGTTITLTPDRQRVLVGTLESLHLLARVIMGNFLDFSRLKAAFAEQVLTHLEDVVQSPEHYLGTIRSEWRSAEVFVLCHEFGHINMGHVDEVRDWHRDPKASQDTLQQRINRRREMEREADSYAVAHMVILMAGILGKRYNNILDADTDPQRMRDYILPVINLFTLFACGHKGAVNFQAAQCPYPSYEERLLYLLSRGGYNSQQWISHAMMAVKFVVEAPIEF